MGWTKDELLAYILLYAANSDYKESNTERNVIISKIDMTTFDTIYREFNLDNDYQSIQKISKAIKMHQYSKEDINMLLIDLKIMFFADGEFDILEQNMFRIISRIVND